VLLWIIEDVATGFFIIPPIFGLVLLWCAS